MMDTASSSHPQESLLPLVAIVGPTASGKSVLAVSIAERFGGDVIACDSTQVYRGLDIGTAKPADEERENIPHHMLDLVEPSEAFNAGEYRRRAIVVLEDLRRRRRLPVFTVGTGLYFRALLEGLADAPQRSEDLRLRLGAIAARRGSGYLHSMLRRFDMVAARRISPNDRQKLVRALEICLLSGKPVSKVHQQGRKGLLGYLPIKIGLNPPRPALHERIERRVQKMLARGWINEVAALVGKGAGGPGKAFELIGYRQLREHLANGVPLEQAAAAIARATRQYAKRQLTWFRREPGVNWFAGFGDDASVVTAVLELLARSLGG